MRSFLVISLVLVWCIDQSYVYGTLGDFMSALPREIGEFENDFCPPGLFYGGHCASILEMIADSARNISFTYIINAKRAFTVAWGSMKDAMKNPTKSRYKGEGQPHETTARSRPRPKTRPIARHRTLVLDLAMGSVSTEDPIGIPTAHVEPPLMNHNNKYVINFRIPMEPPSSTTAHPKLLIPVLPEPEAPAVYGSRSFGFNGRQISYSEDEDDYYYR